MKQPVILAIDTSTGACSAAVWKGGRVTALREAAWPVTQSTRLMPMVEEVLKESGIGYDDLTAVACTVGPGSFTGIRVGLASARGICFATKLPGLGFTTLETMAFAAANGKTPVLALLNAGKGECYFQAFDASGHALGEAVIGTAETAVATAPGARVVGAAPGKGEMPRADALAALAASRTASASELVPVYIRPPDAKLPAKSI